MLKATILSRVNKICKRAETDIDDILLEALEEIALRTGVLITQTTGSTTADQAYIAAPTDLAGKQIHSIYLDDDKPKSPITWQQYLNNNIPGYCLHNNRIYLRANPAGTETYTLDYSKVPTSVSDLSSFPDEFQTAIVRLVASKLYEKYEMYDKIENQLILFERYLDQLSGYESTDPVCQYNGMEL